MHALLLSAARPTRSMQVSPTSARRSCPPLRAGRQRRHLAGRPTKRRGDCDHALGGRAGATRQRGTSERTSCGRGRRDARERAAQRQPLRSRRLRDVAPGSVAKPVRRTARPCSVCIRHGPTATPTTASTSRPNMLRPLSLSSRATRFPKALFLDLACSLAPGVLNDRRAERPMRDGVANEFAHQHADVERPVRPGEFD